MLHSYGKVYWLNPTFYLQKINQKFFQKKKRRKLHNNIISIEIFCSLWCAGNLVEDLSGTSQYWVPQGCQRPVRDLFAAASVAHFVFFFFFPFCRLRDATEPAHSLNASQNLKFIPL